MVHEVAKANESADHSDWYHQTVEGPERTAMCHISGIDENGDDDAYCSAMAGKSAFPYLEDVAEVLRIVCPVVEKYVSEPCSHYCGDCYIYKQGA